MGKQKRKGDSKIIAHARRELELCGSFEKSESYDGSMGRGILALIKTFDDWFHGDKVKADAALDGFWRLLQGELLSPPTDDPTEWEAVEGATAGTVRNLRNPFFVSTDSGKTWMHLQSKERGNSRDHITGKDPIDESAQQEKSNDNRRPAAGPAQEKPGNPIGHVNPAPQAGAGTDVPPVKQTGAVNDKRSNKSTAQSDGSGLDAGVEAEGSEAPGNAKDGAEAP